MEKLEKYFNQKKTALMILTVGCIFGLTSYFFLPEIATTASFVLIYTGLIIMFSTMEEMGK